MSATNHTTNYELPIFVGTDKPAWLVDWNGAMTAIDTALHQVEGKADQAGTDIGGIESSISTINNTLTSINNAVSQLRIDTNANTGSINTITSLIGNGLPTTTDKTIIGAINEIVSDFTLDNHDELSISTSLPLFPNVNEVNMLTNDDGTVGKIYGGIFFYDASGFVLGASENVVATLSSSLIPSITEPYDIFIGFAPGTVQATGLPSYSKIVLRFKTNKTIDVIADRTEQGASTLSLLEVSLPACLYFLTNLGD